MSSRLGRGFFAIFLQSASAWRTFSPSLTMMVCRLLLRFAAFQREHSFRMPGRQLARAQISQRFFRQVQKAKTVCHRAAAFGKPCCGRFLRIAAPFHELTVSQSLFHGVQVFALKIFNESNLHGLCVRDILDQCRDLRQARQARSTPAAFARYNDISPCGGRTHHDWLQNAVLCNTGRKLGQCRIVKRFARLIFVRLYFRKTQRADAFIAAAAPVS